MVSLGLAMLNAAQADQPGSTSDAPSARPTTPEAVPPTAAKVTPVPPMRLAGDTSAGPPPPAPSTAKILSKGETQSVLGKSVLSATGEDMGQIVNVIVDHSGKPRAVVIDFGGFLGVGSRKIAVDWDALHFAPQGKPDQVTLDLTRDQLKAAPEYKEGSPVVVIGNAGNTQSLPQGELP